MDTSDSTSIPDGFKRCSKCGEIKLITIEFFELRKDTSKFRSSCKKCEQKRKQTYQQNHTEEIRYRNLIYRTENIEQIKEYQRIYRTNHIEKRREYARYWKNTNREKVRINNRLYAKKYPDKIKDQVSKWRKKNSDKMRIMARKWRYEHPANIKKSQSKWAKNHPEQVRLRSRTRNAKKRELPHNFSGENWRRALEYFNGCCAYCGHTPSFFDVNTVLQQEHHIAQSKGGGYTPDNILPACQSCNFSKGTKDVHKWLVDHFGKSYAKKKEIELAKYFEFIKTE